MAGGAVAPRAAVLPTLKGVLPWEGRCAPVGPDSAGQANISNDFFVIFFFFFSNLGNADKVEKELDSL